LLFLALAFAALPVPAAPATPAARESARVRAVTDGDTVVLADGRRVRLVGINAPETSHDGRPAEPLAVAARERLAALVAGRTVQLEFGAERQDRYGRTLAHLWLPDGRLVQDDLLTRGLAVAIAVPPNLRHLERYLAAEAGARAAGRGVWSDPYFAPRRAADLGAADQGFRFVHGTVEHVGRSRKYIYLDLAPDVALVIAAEDWRRYFGDDDPRDWRGRRIQARGWLSQSGDGRLRMRIHHPRMLATYP